ncbi:MAG: hypothetical protein ACTSSA_12575 [Candidatus Freyarchaeota archaeon]
MPDEKRDKEFEMKLIEKPISIWCWCREYQQTAEKMADGWNCTCDLLYKEEGEEVETRFFLEHIGFTERKKHPVT